MAAAQYLKGQLSRILIAGSGALNLDLIYEVDSIAGLKVNGRPLEPGRELWGGRRQAQELLEQLEARGRLVAKVGGGSCANTLSILAYLGVNCAFIGAAGDDPEGEFILNSMVGVDVSGVVRKGSSSICLVILDAGTRDRAMFVAAGQGRMDSPTDRMEQVLREAGLFHFSSLAMDEGPRLQLELLDLLAHDALASFDPGEVYARRGLSDMEMLIERSRLVFMTDFELELLFGASSGRVRECLGIMERARPSALEKEMALCLPLLVEKAGSKGAWLHGKGQELFSPAVQVDRIVDNTGAGDAFDAGFILGMLLGLGPSSCLGLGHMVASRSLSGYGRQWFHRLDDLYDEMKERGMV